MAKRRERSVDGCESRMAMKCEECGARGFRTLI